jgi:glycerol-3-phosphate O-acyltransferase
MVYTNDFRLRSGKFSKPIMSDISVLWLLQAYITSMQAEGKTVHLVPLVISHERLFDIRHLATEMVSGVKKQFSVIEMMNLIS